jgi:hypothetical protein
MSHIQGSRCFTLEDGTYSLFLNVVKKLPTTLRKIPKERRHHLHRGGSLKSLYLVLEETSLAHLQIRCQSVEMKAAGWRFAAALRESLPNGGSYLLK